MLLGGRDECGERRHRRTTRALDQLHRPECLPTADCAARRQTIAWLDQPGVPNQRLAWAHTLSTTTTNAPPCAFSALHLEADLNGGMGQVYGRLWVHNVSSSECEVQGLPDVDLMNDAGDVVAHTDPALAQADASAPVVLAPDSWAQAILGLVAASNPGLCAASPAFAELAIRLGSEAATIAYRGGGLISPECPPPTVPSSPTPLFGMSAFAPIPDPSQYQFLGITARIEAPASVRAGEVLRYAVLFVNTSNDDVVPFSPSDCPIYRESVADASGQYVLNCGAVNSLSIPARTRDSLRDGAQRSRVHTGRAHELGVEDNQAHRPLRHRSDQRARCLTPADFVGAVSKLRPGCCDKVGKQEKGDRLK